MDKLKTQLKKRGARNFISLRRQFKVMDDNNDGVLNYAEFVKGLLDFRIGLVESEIKELFKKFDVNNDNAISIEEFCAAYVGTMNESRKALVNQVFDKIDGNNDDMITMNEMKLFFSSRGHPDVKTGQKTQDEILGEFIDTFEMHLSTLKGRKDQRVSRSEFIGYYNYFSSAIDSDEYFETLIRNAWRLFKGSEPVAICNVGLTEAKPDILKHREHQPTQSGASGYKLKSPFGIGSENHYGTSSQAFKNPKSLESNPVGGNPAGITSWPGYYYSDPKWANGDQKCLAVLQAIRETLITRGIRGVLGLARLFRIMDTDHSHTLNFYEFMKGSLRHKNQL
jgi:Ca2+-binding EF-hand superfamily protein